MMDVITHYDHLIDIGNDPVLDPQPLKDYMDKWDGDLFIELLSPQKHMTALEIGCGSGRLLLKTAPLLAHVTGIDISPKTVQRACQNVSYNNVNVICGDFLTYDFDTRFDIIYSSLTFMHIKEKSLAAEKIFSLLNNGGRLVLSTDKNPDHKIDMGDYSVEIYPDSPDKMLPVLQNAGFCNIKIHETEMAFIFVAQRP